MKHIKYYKDNFNKFSENDIKVGDYVIIEMPKKHLLYSGEHDNYIGKVISARPHYDEIEVYFETFISNRQSRQYFPYDWVKYKSSNKEDLEMYINTKKYNI
jgi:hypothetical protein